MNPYRRRRGIVPLILNLGTGWMRVVNIPPQERTRYPFHGRKARPQNWFELAGEEKNFLPGFEPRTVQPVASRYTD
jgi:hypothetical protein